MAENRACTATKYLYRDIPSTWVLARQTQDSLPLHPTIKSSPQITSIVGDLTHTHPCPSLSLWVRTTASMLAHHRGFHWHAALLVSLRETVLYAIFLRIDTPD